MNHKDGVSIEKLTPELVDTAVALCDAYVGENMYSTAEIASGIAGDKNFFYLLYDEARNPIGYTYFLLRSKAEFLAFSKLTEAQFDTLGLGEDAVIGGIQSIAVIPEARGRHYAKLLFDFTLNYLHAHTPADIAAGALWKMGEEVPMKRVFEQYGFTHLADTELVWYDKTDMYCPYCKGRCVCGASVYYKKLEVKR